MSSKRRASAKLRPIHPEFRIPRDRLPSDRGERDALLQDYLAEWVPSTRLEGGDWLLSARPPPEASYFVDPRIKEGLDWWRRTFGPTPLRDVLLTHKTRTRVGLSLSDAWTLHTFSRALTDVSRDRPVVVLHVDDHEDLQAPRLVLSPDDEPSRHPIDVFTGCEVDEGSPQQVAQAIRSGAIGWGSFLTPLVYARNVEVRHLKPGPFRGREAGRYVLQCTRDPDPLAGPNVMRPRCAVGPPDSAGRYLLAEELEPWLDRLSEDAVLLLHIDADAFNDRYDGDSDWQEHTRRHDPPADRVAASVQELVDAVSDLLPDVAASHIALSPGFFPAELWQPTVEALLAGLASHGTARRHYRKSVPSPPLAPPEVSLEPGKGGPGHGSGPGGLFWHVLEGSTRAGSVWINKEFGPDGTARASMTIHLNEASRGRGIGRAAYALAAEASGLDEVWLHMRRSNRASRRAAEYAGFHVIDAPADPQLVMRWVAAH